MKTLLVHASFGEGHKRAAEALGKFLDAPCVDMMDFCHPTIKKYYIGAYMFATQHLTVSWKLLFIFSRLKIFRKIVSGSNALVFSRFAERLRQTRPQILVTTHFYVPAVAALVKKELNLKIISVVTDFCAHPIWQDDAIDHYFTPGENAKNDLMKMGVPENKILSGYAALREGFLRPLSADKLREKFSLDDKPCLLFVSSIRGIFPFLEQNLGQMLRRFNVIVIYGKNKKLLRCLQNHDCRSLRYFSFYEQMWELFAISSVIISKPGGLTVFEGIFLKKMFIFTHYIPGQEEANMKLLIKNNVARYAKTNQQFLDAIEYLLLKNGGSAGNYPVEIKDMRAALKTFIDSQ